MSDSFMHAGIQSYSGLHFDGLIFKMFLYQFYSIAVKILGTKLIKLIASQTF